MRVTAIRHTSVDVEPGVCYGQTDVGVNELTFSTEAADAAARLAELPGGYDGVFRSTLTRCRRLAEACGYADATPDVRLMEMNFGEWEMQRYDEIDDPRLQEWYDDWLHVAATGGESADDQLRRVAAFIEEQRQRGLDNLLLFAHGGVCAQLLRLSGLTAEEAFASQPRYGGIIELNL